MRVTINIEILRKLPRVGGHQHVFYLLNAMNKVIVNDSLILLNNSFKRGKERQPELPEITNPAITCKNLKVSKKILEPLQKLTGFPRLEHLIGRFDVYHEPAHGALPLSTKAKKVCTIHDLVPMRKEYVPESYWEYMKDYFKKSVKWADAIITDSEYTKSDIIDTFKVDGNNITVVPNAAHHGFRPIDDKQEKKSVCDKYGIKKDFLFYVGRIEPRKNVKNIVKAYNTYRNSTRDAPLLVIAGETTWASEDVVEEVKKSPFRDDIFMLGFLPEEDLPFLMNSALCFVFPSLWEGFGLPILEAMACGTPVITSNVTSNPEVAGNAALLVSPGEVDEIAEAFSKVVSGSELRETLIRKGFERNSQFSWERCARETISVYHSLI